jgi:hypothetical protein
MGLRLLAASPILVRHQLLHRQQLVNQRRPLGRTGGHAHFWQRAAANSRRAFLQQPRWLPDWQFRPCFMLP